MSIDVDTGSCDVEGSGCDDVDGSGWIDVRGSVQKDDVSIRT